MFGSLPSELSPPVFGGGGRQERPACPEEERTSSTGSAEAVVEEIAGVEVDSERFGIVGWCVNSGAGRRLRLWPNDLFVIGYSLSSSEEGKVAVGGGRSWESSWSEWSDSPWSAGGEGGFE